MEIKYGSYNFSDNGIATPNVNYSYRYDTNGAGQNIGASLEISMNGKIEVQNPTLPSPTILASGVRDAFEQDYKSFQILCDGTEVFPNNGALSADIAKGIHATNISFSNNTSEYWGAVIDFEITLSAPIQLTSSSSPYADLYVSSLTDSYSIEESDIADYKVDSNTAYYPKYGGIAQKEYTINHTVSANGKAQNGKTAYQNAKDAVQRMLDINRIDDAISDLTIYDRLTTKDFDLVAGSYTLTETFKAFSGTPTKSYTHTFTINNTLDSQFKRTVTVNGTVKGYDIVSDYVQNLDPEKTDLLSAYTNASGAFTNEVTATNVYNRVNNAVNFPSGRYGGYINRFDATSSYPDFKLYQDNLNHNPKTNRLKWLHPVATSFTTEHNVNDGEITYSCSFDNRPLNLIPGAITESLSVNDTYPTTGYASQNVQYRGAIMQALGTTTTPSRTVSYTATFPDLVVFDAVQQNTLLNINTYDNTSVNNIFAQFDPKNMHGIVYSWVVDEQVQANPIEGSFSKTKTWNYVINNQII